MGAVGAVLGLGVGSLPFVLGSRDQRHGWRRGQGVRPDPSRRLVIVADPHWGEELTGLQEAALAMPDSDWLFLGDVFDVWVGVNGLATDAQRNFIWWVTERRRTGHWVGLWLGNREYFLDGLADKFDFIGEGTGGSLQGEFAFEHGDLIVPADRMYRLWNLLSRSGPVWLLARLIPPFLGSKLAVFLEKRLRGTNRGFKREFPRESFQKAAEECGMPIFVTGHFHAHEVVGQGTTLPMADEGRFCLWENGGLRFEDCLPQTHAGHASASES